MATSDEPPALAHIEKTLADAYRKEIDQEENVWRSLPFFAATLALQLAALFQLVDRLPPLETWAGKIAVGLLGLSGLATLTALCFLAACIYPRKFQYLAPDPELLAYAEGLIADEKAAGENAAFNALVTLKETLALQYAVGSHHNRQINKLRERLRSIAGLATVLSVVLMLLLVGTTFVHYIPNPPQRGPGHVQATTQPDADQPDPEGAVQDTQPEERRGDEGNQPRLPEAPPANAGDNQGLVDPSRGTGER